MLTFENVWFKYLDENILEGLSFNVQENDFVSIIGASGCGKSTIFRLINKLESADLGNIKTNAKVGYMPQKDLLIPWKTVLKNVCLPLEIAKQKQGLVEKAEQILKDVGLFEYKDKYPYELSGGMKQRVSFARALLTQGQILLLDEPFSSLDSLTKIDLQEWLLKVWQKHKKTIVFITHDVEEAIFLSKKIYIVNETPIKNLEQFDILLDYPRNRDDMKKSDIIELKEQLISKLRVKK